MPDKELLPAEMTDEQLVERYENTGYLADDLEDERVTIRAEFVGRLTKARTDSRVVSDFTINKKKMVKFPKTTMEFAREMGAIKETIDTVILRRLVDKGIKVEGKEVVIYVTIQRKREKNGEK